MLSSMSIYAIDVIFRVIVNQQKSRINDVLYYIHKDISQALPAKQLATVAAYSEQHFHRVFKEVVGESVHDYVRRARLEFAANQLMFDGRASILEVAIKCGFVSVSSFSRAFKSVFGVSPGAWRKPEHHELNAQQAMQNPYLKDAEIAQHYKQLASRAVPDANLIELPARHVAYVRHQGYDRSIKLAWQTLLAWAKQEQRSYAQQFALHHSNPAWVELSQCRYVACIAIDKPLQKRGLVNSLTIPGGLHGVFKLQGQYGELLPQLSHILERWLPSSGFKMQSTPAYVHYKKNHFLQEDERFELDFFLPLSI